jgi:hypothetical protein
MPSPEAWPTPPSMRRASSSQNQKPTPSAFDSNFFPPAAGFDASTGSFLPKYLS